MPSTPLLRVPTGRRAACGCLVEALEYLDGQHAWYCNNPIDNQGGTRRFQRLGQDGPLTPHTVDEVPMPCASLGGVDLSIRWCDISAEHDGDLVARRFDDTFHYAMASRTASGWHWRLFFVPGEGDQMQVLAEGDAEKAVAMIEDVWRTETQLELAA
jgi:hypothetical protein